MSQFVTPLPPDVVKVLNENIPGLGTTLNDRLRQIAVHLDKDIATDVTYGSTVDVEGNLATGVADPVENSDLVNFRRLKDETTCKRLTEILRECIELETTIETDADFGAGAEVPFFFGFCVYNPLSTTGGSPNLAANDVVAWLFVMPVAITVTALTYEIIGADAGKSLSVGLYDSNKTKIIDSGVQSASAAGTFTIAVTSTRVEAGLYYLAYTSNGTPSIRQTDHTTTYVLLNKTTVRCGKDGTASSGGALPASLGTLTSGSRNPPLVLFEA